MLVAEIDPRTAFILGVIPFLPGEVVKTAVAAYIASTYDL